VILLKKHEYSPSGLTTSEEWRLMIKAQIDDIRCEVYSRIYVKKDFRSSHMGTAAIKGIGNERNSLPMFTITFYWLMLL
jgi:hypothetical protein